MFAGHEGAGWGGGGMLTFLGLLPRHVATLHRCLVVLLRCIHEGVRCGRGGMLLFLVLLPLHVAMLHRCLVVLLLCTHEGMGWGRGRACLQRAKIVSSEVLAVEICESAYLFPAKNKH